MSILNQPEIKLNSALIDTGIKLTILPLPDIGQEVWTGALPSTLMNNRDKISKSSNKHMRVLTECIREWLLSKSLEDFETPEKIFRSMFPNLQYAGYINRHFVYVNHENKPCLIIGII